MGWSRRRVLGSAGAAVGGAFGTSNAPGAEARSVEASVEQSASTVLTTFEATAENASLEFNGDVSMDTQFGFQGPVELTGEIHADGSWTATSVSVPPLKMASFVERETPARNPTVQTRVTGSVTGTYDPANDPAEAVMTVSIPLAVDIEVTSGSATTGPIEPTASRGSASSSRLFAIDTSVTATANGFEIPAFDTNSGGRINAVLNNLNDTLGLPNATSSRLRLPLDIQVADRDALAELLTVPPVVTLPPRDLDDDGVYEDIIGNGQVDIRDSTTLLAYIDSETVVNYPWAFDFSEFSPANETSILDVAAHWRDHVFGNG
jgi:hypothetical protein